MASPARTTKLRQSPTTGPPSTRSWYVVSEASARDKSTLWYMFNPSQLPSTSWWPWPTGTNPTRTFNSSMAMRPPCGLRLSPAGWASSSMAGVLWHPWCSPIATFLKHARSITNSLWIYIIYNLYKYRFSGSQKGEEKQEEEREREVCHHLLKAR